MSGSTRLGGPAFPIVYDPENQVADPGMWLRDYFAIHAPEPSNERVQLIMQQEQAANPHNEPYPFRVRRRGEQEIRCALRYEFADEMIKVREGER